MMKLVVFLPFVGGCNFLVLIPWILLVYDTPFEHPRIEASEIKRIRHRRRDSTVAKVGQKSMYKHYTENIYLYF